ncbi:MAG: hypothetical protein JXB47_20820 [Anaerolineae bacterium]|nr:hypothetical protein [Anaerolineae bacterium]
MDSSLAITVASYVLVGFVCTGMVISLTLLSWRLLPVLRNGPPPAPSITTGDHSPVNVSQASGQAQSEVNGVYTNTQIYEDALAKLCKVTDDLAVLRDIILAVQQGRYRGDITEMFGELFDDAEQHAKLAALILQRGRSGDYAYRTSMRDLHEAFDEHTNGRN